MCMETFEASGARAEVRPFLCQSGVAHSICSACDRTMYNRHDDRCPTCRASRSGSSVQRNGPRPIALPPPMDGGLGLTMPDHVNIMAGVPRVHPTPDFLSWLPRRIGIGIGEAAVRNRAGLTQAGGSYGGRAFYPDESELSLPRILATHHAASASRRSRGLSGRSSSNANMLHSPISGLPIFRGPVDLTGDDSEPNPDDLHDPDDPDDPDDPRANGTAHDAALAAMLTDEGIVLALEGLRNIPGISTSEFARRVRWFGPGPVPVIAGQTGRGRH